MRKSPINEMAGALGIPLSSAADGSISYFRWVSAVLDAWEHIRDADRHKSENPDLSGEHARLARLAKLDAEGHAIATFDALSL